MVEGQHNVLSRPLLARGHDVDRLTRRVADDRLVPRPSGELLVERAFEPVEPLVVRPREAEELGCDAPLRIGPALLGVEPDPRDREPLEELGLRRVGLAVEEDELLRVVGEPGEDGVRVDAERLPCLDRRPPRGDDVPRIGVHGRRELADRERLARPVEDGAASRRDLDRLPLLLRGHRGIRRSVDDLDPGRTSQRDREQRREPEHQQADPGVRPPVVRHGASRT